jgi:hypothetical protein
LLWLVLAVMILGAVMLVVGFGAPGLWVAVITVGIAIVAINQIRRHHPLGS